MPTIYYKAAIRRVTPGAQWFHLPPLDRKAEHSGMVRRRMIDIPFGTSEILEYSRVGHKILVEGLYYYPDEESGLQFQHNLRDQLFDNSGVGYELDVCLLIHSGGTLTEIFRSCSFAQGEDIKFTDGHTERWRKWSISLESRDPGLYTSGSNSSGIPPGGPYEIWSGRGLTTSATGASNTSAATASQGTVQVSNSGAFAVGNSYVWGTEVIHVTAINSGTNTLTVDRNYGQSTSHTHMAGDPIYSLVDPPSGGGASSMGFAHLTWDEEFQVANSSNDATAQQQLMIRGGNPALHYFQLTASDDGPGGADGSMTTVRIAKAARATAPATYQECTLSKGSTAGPIVTGTLTFSDGDTLYAWGTTTARHSNVRLRMIF